MVEPNQELDVQWVANIVLDHPTPAAGDSTQAGDDWYNVEDPNFGDQEDINEQDGEPIE